MECVCVCVYARMHFITTYRNTKYKAKLPKITAQTLHVKHAAHSARNEPTLFHPAPLSPVRRGPKRGRDPAAAGEGLEHNLRADRAAKQPAAASEGVPFATHSAEGSATHPAAASLSQGGCELRGKSALRARL